MRYLIRDLAVLIIAFSSAAFGQVIPSRELPALPEPSWTFVDGSNTYYVGKQTGAVLVVRSGDNLPPDDIRPTPPPAPDNPTEDAAWFSVIVDPNSAEQASWRTAPELRAELEKLGIQYRTYAATERDTDLLGFRRIVTENGLPTVIIQDKTGKILKAISPKSLTEVQIIAESLK